LHEIVLFKSLKVQNELSMETARTVIARL